MRRRILPLIACVAVLVVLLIGGAVMLAVRTPASAQQPPPGPRAGGAFEDVKKQLGASDEEWKVIQPKLQKVIEARQTLATDARGPVMGFGRGGFGGFPGGPGGFGPPGGFGGFPGGPPGGGFPGGPGAPPQPGQVMPAPLQDALKLTDAQKKELEQLQKEVDARLAKLLTDEQKKQLKDMQAGGGPPGGPGGGFPGGPPGGFGGPPPGGPGGGTASGAIGQAQADLKTTLDDPKHNADEVKEKVAAVRKARQKVRAELETAQKDLLKLLTAEQEAVLVSLGYIE
jgi:Spy/CpxP family protein refolding chaperone